MSDNKSKCLAAEKLVQKLSGKLGDNRSDHAEKLVEDKEVLIPRQSQCCLDYAIDIIIITIIVITIIVITIIVITITITIITGETLRPCSVCSLAPPRPHRTVV